MSRQPSLSASARSLLRAALLTSFALACAGVAGAAVRYVSPTGSDSNTGASPSSAWASISKANSTLQAGDVCYVSAGNYSNSISPTRSGTASARITFIGNPGNPGSVVIPGISLDDAYVTVKGFSADNALDLNYPARNDSVVFCVLGHLMSAAAKDCMVAHNTINGRVGFYANLSKGCYNKLVLDTQCMANTERDTVRGNVINLGSVAGGEKAWDMRAWTQHCLIDSNRVAMTFNNTTGSVDESFAIWMFHSYFNTFRDNHWTMDAVTPTACANCNWDAFRARDSTNSNTWERDTMLIGQNSTNPIRWLFSASGDFDGYLKYNKWTNCFVKTRQALWTQDDMDEWTIENSVIMSQSDRALFITKFKNSYLRHNTFYSPGQAVWIDNYTGDHADISSNVFYSTNASQANSNGGGVFFDGQRTPGAGFTSDNNLYFTPTYRSSPGDLSLMWCCWSSSKPGAGTSWASATGQDTHSKYGSPRFIDSTFAGFDPRLGAGSLARGVGAGGSDAGVQWLADVTAPGTVSKIDTAMVSDRYMVLKWTAPGDDGAIGVVAAYDLRWSNQPITAANFTSAAAVSVQPPPLPAGSLQQQIMSGLTPSSDYYFAIRSRDEAGNWSQVSPATYVRTLSFDRLPPAVVRDLGSGP